MNLATVGEVAPHWIPVWGVEHLTDAVPVQLFESLHTKHGRNPGLALLRDCWNHRWLGPHELQRVILTGWALAEYPTCGVARHRR